MTALFARTLLSLVIASTAVAAPVRHGAVEVEFVSSLTAIQPGFPFTVALRMKHDPQWHTYWQNPGTGYPTSLDWKLPEGFKAAGIDWPVPSLVKDAAGEVTGYGYEGENFLLVKITPPAGLKVGTEVTLRASAEWLMCKEVCMPGNAELSLTLPVGTERPAPDQKWAPKLAEFTGRLPVALPPGWSADATRKGAFVELHLKTGAGTRPDPRSLYFFSSDGFIDYVPPQEISRVPDGYFFRLVVSDSADPKVERLIGVIRAADGWGQAGEVVGLSVNAGIRVDVTLAR